MNLHALVCGLLILLPVAGQGGASADYSLAPAAIDQGGLHAVSMDYACNSTIMPGAAGSSPDYALRAGFAGQLSDAIATAIEITAPQSTLAEGAGLQLSASLIYDDLTTVPLSPSSVTWSIQSGPISGISTSGLATAAVVYENTAAVVHGSSQTFTDTLALTVLNVDADNFGTYAADGIDDQWQVQYFGLNNPQAGPAIDADSDGQNNLFEFMAGIVPTDSQSRFRIEAQAVPGQVLQKRILFSPRFADRVYLLQSSTGLPGTWITVDSTGTTDNGLIRTVTDLSATGARKFYRVKVTRP